MKYQGFFAALLCGSLSLPLSAQIARDAKYDILRTVIADQASARVGLPFGSDGVEPLFFLKSWELFLTPSRRPVFRAKK